jgi:hypothetical protein
MKDTLLHVEKNIAETQEHIGHQRHIIAMLREHGHVRDVPTAEVLLETLTTSLAVLCERKETLLKDLQERAAPSSKPRLQWISK